MRSRPSSCAWWRTAHSSPCALSALHAYAWPGNVRELSHVMERAELTASGAQIAQLDFSLPVAVSSSAPVTPPTLDEAEQDMIRNALERCSGNIQKTAEMLGLSRAALYRRLEKFGMRRAEG